MIIILEGPDGSGKTTLANALAKQTKYPIKHCVQPKPDESGMLGMYLNLIKSNKNLILDRSWYSEMVYGPVMRGTSEISYPDMYLLEQALVKHGAIIIHCTDKPEVLWCRCAKRGEDYVTNYSTFEAIHKGFNELMNVPHLVPVVKYDYKDL